MKVTILQRNILWNEVDFNLKMIDKMLATLPDVDIFVLPEMFATGFNPNPEHVAESSDGKILAWMKQTAAARNCAICGSVAVSEEVQCDASGKKEVLNDASGEKEVLNDVYAKKEVRYANRFYFVTPNGRVDYYDKHHLFAYGGEHKRYTAGRERVVVEFRGVRILLQVCYDLRFPVFSRNHKDYDMAIYVASWPTPRIEAWNTLLKARAIENQCYVVGVNRIGRDPQCEYCGDSMVVSPYGKVIAECRRDEEGAATALVDIHGLGLFREKFPVLNDAD